MEAHASLVAAPEDTEQILAMIRNMEDVWNAEFMGEEPGLTVKQKQKKIADEANISRQNDERVRCVSNSDQYIIFHIMEE